MVTVTMCVEGMHCGMCEAHVSDAVRKAIHEARQVRASHRKGIVTFVAPQGSGEAAGRAVAALGYGVSDVRETPYVTRGFFAKIFKK